MGVSQSVRKDGSVWACDFSWVSHIVTTFIGWYCVLFRYHSFRHAEEGDDRVRAQIIVKGMILKDRKVIDPRRFLEEKVGVNPDMLGAVDRPNADASIEDMVANFDALENSKRKVSAIDDEKTK